MTIRPRTGAEPAQSPLPSQSDPIADDLAGIERELVRSILRDSFADYCVRYWPVVTGMPLQRNRAVDEVIAVLQLVADGKRWRQLIALPSGVGKSTMLCLFAGWQLARDPSHRAIHMTHAADLAGTESRRVRRLVTSDEHRAMFPELVLREDESTVQAWATTRDGRYYAVGLESALLGRRAKSAVLDDPLDASSRFSRAAREAVWTWFEESLSTRLDGDRAPIIVVHQRLCMDDLIGRLMEQRDGHGEPIWHLLELPAEDDDGVLLAPTILPREKLDALRAQNPRVYATMFLQRPSADDGAKIARTAWGFHAEAEANPLAARPSGCATPEQSPTIITPDGFERTVIAVDMTFGSVKKSGDYCAIHAWSALGPRRFLRERWTKKASQREQRAAIKDFATRYANATVLIEKAAGGAAAIEELIAEGITRIVPIIATNSKAQRFELVEPTISLGLAYLPLGMTGLADLIECLAGSTRHDDDQDAAGMAIHFLNVKQGKRTPAPIGGSRGTEHTFIAAPSIAPSSTPNTPPNIYAAIGAAARGRR